MTTRLIDNWRDPKVPDNYLDAIAEVFMRHPAPIGEECAHTWHGIARTKTRNGEVRTWPAIVARSCGLVRAAAGLLCPGRGIAGGQYRAGSTMAADLRSPENRAHRTGRRGLVCRCKIG
jgi:hypothetical protein